MTILTKTWLICTNMMKKPQAAKGLSPYYTGYDPTETVSTLEPCAILQVADFNWLGTNLTPVGGMGLLVTHHLSVGVASNQRSR
ncbi:MAG: hypothetical protein ACLTZB_03185 [Streptococcus salivarius]